MSGSASSSVSSIATTSPSLSPSSSSSTTTIPTDSESAKVFSNPGLIVLIFQSGLTDREIMRIARVSRKFRKAFTFQNVWHAVCFQKGYVSTPPKRISQEITTEASEKDEAATASEGTTNYRELYLSRREYYSRSDLGCRSLVATVGSRILAIANSNTLFWINLNDRDNEVVGAGKTADNYVAGPTHSIYYKQFQISSTGFNYTKTSNHF